MSGNKNWDDSNISKPGDDQPPGPTRQHHRLARGERVTGMSTPNGPAATKSKIAGQAKNY